MHVDTTDIELKLVEARAMKEQEEKVIRQLQQNVELLHQEIERRQVLVHKCDGAMWILDTMLSEAQKTPDSDGAHTLGDVREEG